MGIEKITVDKFVALSQKYPVIDVRSDGEYNKAHIPGAYSLPLFNDAERSIVGTIYKQNSREAAIKKGLEYFGPKMKEMIDFVENIITKLDQKNKIILVHCWRGGMRSAGVAWLLDLYGFKVYTLIGGYKNYRNWILDQFKKPWNLVILGGYTGSGKTIILQRLEELGENVVDLEGIAGHKGSAFGKIGLPDQPSSEMFENMLATKLLIEYNKNSEKFIWLEDESQRIGLVNIPSMFWSTIRKSKVYFIEIPFEERLNYLVETYGKLEVEELKNAIIRIQKRLGGLETKTALEYLSINDIKNCFSILLKYYDKLYNKSLDNRENLNQLLIRIKSEIVEKNYNAEILINTLYE